MANEVTFESILSGMAQEEIDAYICKAQRAIEKAWNGHHMISVWQNGVDMAKNELEKREKLTGDGNRNNKH